MTLTFFAVDSESRLMISVPSGRLLGRPRTNLLIRTKSISSSEPSNVGIAASEEMARSIEQSDCSLDISCCTVVTPQSASSLCEPNQENSPVLDGIIGLTSVAKAGVDDGANIETLSDASTMSAENSASSTASAPSSLELECQEGSSTQQCGLVVDQPHRRGGQLKRKVSVRKNVGGGTECELLCSDAACQSEEPVSSTDTPNKDQVIVAASNRVQNYLASLGLPGSITSPLLPLLFFIYSKFQWCLKICYVASRIE